MKFLCDAMLGHLARDLRLLGYDAAYDAQATDRALLERARREARTLLTMDRALAQRAGPDGVLVRAVDADAALVEVLDALDLRPPPDALLTRCTRCGGALVPVPSAAAGDAVPPEVAQAHPTLDRCAACGHHYWEGTHARNIRARLRPLLDGRDPRQPREGRPERGRAER